MACRNCLAAAQDLLGIEDEARLWRLLEAGCRFGQGYFLGRPTIPEGLIEKLEHLDQWETALAHVTSHCRSLPGAMGAARIASHGRNGPNSSGFSASKVGARARRGSGVPRPEDS